MEDAMRKWLEENVGELHGNVLEVQSGHGPEPCEGCGIYHTHVRLHMDEHGRPWPQPDLLDEVLAAMEEHLGRGVSPDDVKHVKKHLRRRVAARYPSAKLIERVRRLYS